MPGRVSLVESARNGLVRRDRDEPVMRGKIESTRIAHVSVGDSRNTTPTGQTAKAFVIGGNASTQTSSSPIVRIRIPKSVNTKGATHKRGELRRSVKPSKSAGRSVRQCEVQHRFIGDSETRGSWVARTQRYTEFYLAREAAGIDGDRPEFFTTDKDGNVISADHRAFLDEARHDRYMNEFVVPPNDGHLINDMPGFTGRVISIMEKDLGTKLSWIAVAHEKHDRAHPVGGPKNKHTHVLMRGVDDQGHTLWISREYLSSTLRNVVQTELSAHPTNETEKGWRIGPMSDEEREKFQQQMALNRPDRLSRGWTKATEQELQQMHLDRTRTAEADRDDARERKRDRTRGASMGDE